jgi:hypothetical protein
MTSTVIAAEETTVAAPSVSPHAPPPRAKYRRVPWIVLVSSIAAFCYGVTTVRTAPVNEYGLLVSASPAFGLSILLAALGFVIAVRQHNLAAATAATIAMVVVQRLPTSITTDTPIYSWTYKHIGVTDYIQHEEALARGVDIYNGWPGLFAITAWFSDLTGVPPIAIAHWFTVCFHLGFALMVYGVARAWGLGRMPAVTAAFLVMSLNWVAQDYFSPQATAILFSAAVFILVGLSRTTPVAVPLLFVLFTAETITHQLTPYWVLMVMGGLVIGRKLKPWWIVIPLGVILISFLFYNLDEASQYTLFSFDIAKNAKSNISTVGVVGQQVTSLGVRTLAVAMWLTTTLILLIRWRRKQPFWALAVLALSPMAILGGQGYGGEAIFRVFLYSLMGCSLVLAPVVVAGLQRGMRRFAATTLAVCLAVALSAQGYFGGWFANIMPKDQVDASGTVLENADFPAYLTVAAPVWPQRSTWRYVQYADFSEHFDDPMIFNAKLVGSHLDTDADYEKFCEALAARKDASTYLVFTDQMRLYAWYFGILPLDAFANLKDRLDRDPEWELIYNSNGVTVYLHHVQIG